MNEKQTDCISNDLSYSNPSMRAEYFFVKNEFKLTRIDFRDILYIEGMGDYQCIHTLNERVMTLQTFDKLFMKLPTRCFARIHKSFIISIEKISVIEKNHVRINGKEIPIGMKYKDDFFNQLKEQFLI